MKILLLCILCMVSQPAWSDNPTSLVVQISIDQGSFSIVSPTGVQRFQVNASVKNVSDKDQEIDVWSQYGWNWTSNNPQVLPGKEAIQNVVYKKILKPGEEYSSWVEVFYLSNKRMPMAFRLGFSSKTDKGLPASIGMNKSEGIVWSNEVDFIK